MQLDDTNIIDADTKKKLEDEKVKKLTRHEIFAELKEVDRYFSHGFTTFLISYKPTSLNDINDKLQEFSSVQDKQLQGNTIAWSYINMPTLTQTRLDEYTVFLAKYGPYIVDEIAHANQIEQMIKDLGSEYGHTYTTADESPDHDGDRDQQWDSEYLEEREKNAFDYNDGILKEHEKEQKKIEEEFDEDKLAECLDDAMDDLLDDIDQEADA